MGRYLATPYGWSELTQAERTLLSEVEQMTYGRGFGEWIAYWWEPRDSRFPGYGDSVAWLDDHGRAAVGMAPRARWVDRVKPILARLGYDVGTTDALGAYVLVYNTYARRLWVAPREALDWIAAKHRPLPEPAGAA